MVLVERLVQLVVFDLRKQFYRQTLRLDMASFGEHSSGELMARFINDITALSCGLNNLVGKAIREPLRMMACLIGAAFVSWQLLLFSLLIAPPCLLAMSWLSKSLKRNSRKALEEVVAPVPSADGNVRGHPNGEGVYDGAVRTVAIPRCHEGDLSRDDEGHACTPPWPNR